MIERAPDGPSPPSGTPAPARFTAPESSLPPVLLEKLGPFAIRGHVFTSERPATLGIGGGVSKLGRKAPETAEQSCTHGVDFK